MYLISWKHYGNSEYYSYYDVGHDFGILGGFVMESKVDYD
jgi:hypothetical protein